MKKVANVLWAIAVAGCAVDADESEATQEASATTVSHGTMNGRGADMSTGDAYGNSNLGVFQQGIANDRVTTLWYSAVRYSADFTSLEYEYMYGTIPNDDVELGQREASLHTTAAGVYGEKCSADFTIPTFSCQPFTPTDPILVNWQVDGFISHHYNGTNLTSIGKYSFRTQGNFKANSAQVSGTVFGTTVDGAFGFISDTRGTAVTKDVILTP